MHQVLEQYFGYKTFRPLQEEIIRDVIAGKDVFVLMPTGGGKSLCYQIPSLVQSGTTIVVSPLISLMKDQVDGLVQNGIRAAYLNSSLSPGEQAAVLRQLQNKQLALLYIAPERLAQDQFFRILQTVFINFFAIDEAHCISQWGHDFRPEYRQLAIIRKHFRDKPLVALTATATPRVKNDIIERLGLREEQIYQASFNRPNLSYRIIPKNDPLSQIHDYVVTKKGESGIIYCQSRKTVGHLASRLQENGIRALPYHAGLSDVLRKKHQEQFINEDTDVIVATIAFGMGIDKPNVRYVIHHDLPQSLEHYYQETGRAGRDGLPSDCILLYSYGDVFFYERFIAEKQSEEERRISKAQLHRMVDYAQSKLCRRVQLLQYFAETSLQKKCDSCDNCLSPQEMFDATIIVQKILSCVYRLRQRFGANHITGVLTGSKAQGIVGRNHHLLSTYGIVTDYDRNQLRTFIYELLSQGYLRQSGDQYAILSLTSKSRSVLKGMEKVFLTKPDIRIFTSRQKEAETACDLRLFNKLRFLRKQMADKQNLPPYIIFSDRSLKEMAAYFPQTSEQFSQITGVGAEKLRMHAKPFLQEIIDYCKPLKICPIIKYNNTVAITLGLYREGKNIRQIAEKRGLAESTIHGHLQQTYINGESINIDKFVVPEKQKVILQVFKELGYERLALTKERLGEDYSYAEIRWVQAKILKSNTILE
ncbi:DNA helicase RecQ [Patescibacteria group bacterium]|nr:DNA helicase RecQ [Patescibacteria group bacterium]MBU4016635.1 DNA helicase RecQ [Patescibacteria group bacterium]MBU4098308.1 DNA helicase RecQ [Patescibacteria group bacterium]